ncbi:hypothetical protein PAHAL_4G338000 [Panicum hallii]|uniref:Uncharacterized protein n=1 Tax=Panicum hallii TaxID=206008 RepID=A0A2T8JEY5_9POAL|nr:hypothetical protein PAHAL_4G338000 [Panicum hallii]
METEHYYVLDDDGCIGKQTIDPWKRLQLLVERVGAGAVAEHGVPHPLHQEPAPAGAVHVVRRAGPRVRQQLPRVRAAAACAVDALAEVGDLRRERRVRARVPRVGQRVGRQLRQLVRDDAHHPVHADVGVGRRLGPPPRHVRRDGERVRAHLRAPPRRVAHPRVRERVPHHGREGEVVEAADLPAEVLHQHLRRGEHEIHAAGVHGEGPGARGHGVADHRLDVHPRQPRAAGHARVRLLGAQRHRRRHVGAGLVRVQPHGPPPRRHGGARDPGLLRRRRSQGAEEGADGALLRRRPGAVPDRVHRDGRRQDGAHVVLQLHELRRPLELLGRAQPRRGRRAVAWRPRAPRRDGGRRGEEGRDEEHAEVPHLHCGARWPGGGGSGGLWRVSWPGDRDAL